MLIARVSISKRKAQEKMNSRRIISAGTLLAGVMLFGTVAQGSLSHTLVITENSSTSLTWTLDGGAPQSFTTSTPDSWQIPLTGVSGSPVTWQEPGERTVNSIEVVEEIGGTSPQLFIQSDQPSFTSFPILDNNTPDQSHFTLNGAQLIVTFNDLGDGSTVPDTATTLPLLGLALAALGFAKRRLF
jgi:hypothetical protein